MSLLIKAVCHQTHNNPLEGNNSSTVIIKASDISRLFVLKLNSGTDHFKCMDSDRNIIKETKQRRKDPSVPIFSPLPSSLRLQVEMFRVNVGIADIGGH